MMMRGVEKQIRKIMRKAALELSKDPSQTIVVDKDDVAAYLGKPAFTEDELICARCGQARLVPMLGATHRVA